MAEEGPDRYLSQRCGDETGAERPLRSGEEDGELTHAWYCTNQVLMTYVDGWKSCVNN